VLLGADTEALEVEPSVVAGDPMPVHVACLVRHGVHILEFAYLEELAADRRYEFAFVCSCPRVRGATAALARPLALV
jgi:hypothetical protein